MVNYWDIFSVNYGIYSNFLHMFLAIIFSKLWDIFLANYGIYFDKLWNIISINYGGKFSSSNFFIHPPDIAIQIQLTCYVHVGG